MEPSRFSKSGISIYHLLITLWVRLTWRVRIVSGYGKTSKRGKGRASVAGKRGKANGEGELGE